MILSRTTANMVLLFFIAFILGLFSLVWTFSVEGGRFFAARRQEACIEHCFPFAQKIEDEDCLCADLDGNWNKIQTTTEKK